MTWQLVDRDSAIVASAHADRRRPSVRVLGQWLEEEGGGSGKSDAQSIIRKLAGIPAYAYRETADKDVRIRAFAGQWQSRMC